jgi:hypothetical protein
MFLFFYSPMRPSPSYSVLTVEIEVEMLLLTFDTRGRWISFCGVSLNIADLKITAGFCSAVRETWQFPSKSGNVPRVVAYILKGSER